jgi:hypothetical protein
METIVVRVPERNLTVSKEGVQGPPGPTFPTITLTIGDEVNPIATNTQGHTSPIPFNCRILSYSIASLEQLPSPQNISVEFFKDNFETQFPPTTKISGNAPIRLVNQVVRKEDINQDEWQTYLSEGDCLGFRVVSTDNIPRKIMITIKTVRTF